MGGFLLTRASRVFLTINLTDAAPRLLDAIIVRTGITSSLILT
jgi:hypothetical protein